MKPQTMQPLCDKQNKKLTCRTPPPEIFVRNPQSLYFLTAAPATKYIAVIPSIPASQALRLQLQQSLSSQSSSASPQRDLSPVSTGLSSLDDAISASTSASTPVGGRGGRGGGFARGSVAEVYGPPGVGKTCLLYSLPLSYYLER